MPTSLNAWLELLEVRHPVAIDLGLERCRSVWQRMGSPQDPTTEQFSELKEAARLARLSVPEMAAIENGKTTVRFRLPRQGVSLVMLHLAIRR